MNRKSIPAFAHAVWVSSADR